MKCVFSRVARVFCNIALVFSLAALMLPITFMLSAQPSYADMQPDVTVQEDMGSIQQEAESLQKDYDAEASAVSNPKGVEKEYEENLADYRKAHRGENSLVEEAKQLVEKVTGRDE